MDYELVMMIITLLVLIMCFEIAILEELKGLREDKSFEKRK